MTNKQAWRTRSIKILELLVVLVSVVGFMASPAAAQLNSNVGTVVINANLAESLTVTVNSGATVTCTLTANTAANPCAPSTGMTTAWVLKPGRTTVKVYAYFSSATAALTPVTAGNTVNFPSSSVSIQVGGAGAFSPLVNATPYAGGALSGLQIGPTIAITGLNKNSNRVDTLAYQIDTTVVPQAPADTYTGTLNLQAQATP